MLRLAEVIGAGVIIILILVGIIWFVRHTTFKNDNIKDLDHTENGNGETTYVFGLDDDGKPVKVPKSRDNFEIS